jgi:hypothetical protein
VLKPTVFTLCVLLLTVQAYADEQIMIGGGSQSCGQWLEARRGKSTNAYVVLEQMIISWVQGYLIGIAHGISSERMIPYLAERIARYEVPSDIIDSDSKSKLLKIQQERFGTNSGWVFDPPDFGSMTGWLDKHCREHPLDSVINAENSLSDELEDRQTKRLGHVSSRHRQK